MGRVTEGGNNGAVTVIEAQGCFLPLFSPETSSAGSHMNAELMNVR